MTIGQTPTVPDTNSLNNGVNLPAMVSEPIETLPPVVEPLVRTAGNPWKTSDGHPPREVIPSDEFPPVNAPPPAPDPRSRHISSNYEPENRSRDSFFAPVRSPQEHGYEHRARSGSFNRDGRMNQSGDARYQYEQNTFDRHWQIPLPQTREIFNSTTGRFEQIDATQKQARRPSHHERKSTDILQRPQLLNGDARKLSNREASPVLSNVPAITAEKSTSNNNGTAAKDVSVITAEVVKPNLNQPEIVDPSSPEFIEMQKKLMAERREQAIQRRKDQEAEETARKERARKKAAELTALAEKERQQEADAKSMVKEAAQASTQQPRLLTRRPAQTIENNLLAQKDTSEAGRNEPTMRSSDDKTDESARKALWQRGVTLPIKKDVHHEINQQDSGDLPAHRDPFDNAASSISRNKPSDANLNEASRGSRNVWGPIGPKNNTRAGPILGTFGLDNDMSITLDDRKFSTSPESALRSREQITSPSWSAFDSIQPRRIAVKNSENREYNVFDAADEVITPEKHRQSPQGQSQANRTSSRFFPSPSGPIAPKSSKVLAPFVSPEMPPQIDSDESIHFEPLGTAPALLLPSTPSRSSRKTPPSRSIDQIIATIQSNVQDSPQSIRYDKRQRLDIQTRTVWEVKPLKEGYNPRVRVPHKDKELDWSRKEKAATEVAVVKAVPEPVNNLPALPVESAWALPKNLEIMSKLSSITEPLLPPKPSLKIPESIDQVISPIQVTKRKPTSKFEQERLNKYYTTRYSLEDDSDSITPIRIKTSEVDIKIQRKFGKRVETPQKKVADVKRQPVNMSDTPGGSGFKRGFANRVKGNNLKETSNLTTAASSTTKIQLRNENVNSSTTDNIAENTPKFTVAQRPPSGQTPPDIRRLAPSPANKSVERPSSNSFSRPSSMSSQMASPHMGSPIQYAHQTVSQMSLSQSPMLPRVAPPGLSAPMNITTTADNVNGHGPMMNHSPAPVARGPPGIVLP